MEKEGKAIVVFHLQTFVQLTMVKTSLVKLNCENRRI